MPEVLKAILIANCCIWILVTLQSFRDAISVFRLFGQTRPGFRSYILFQLFYLAGTFLLGIFSIAITFMHSEIVLTNSLFVFVLLVLGVMALIANHFYQKALSGEDGVVDLFAVNQYFVYLSESREKKKAAQKVRALIPAKYLERSTLKARVLLPSIRYMIIHLGDSRTLEILDELGVPLAYLQHHDSDINIEFSNDLFESLMRETGRGPDVVFEAQASGANIDCMGALFFLIARLLSVHNIYKTICRLSHFLDENFTNEIVENDKGVIVLRCHFKNSELLGRFNELCVYSIAGWISSIPNLKGLPHAKVEVTNSPFLTEKTSDDYIEFKVSWVEHLSDAGEISKMIY